MRSFRARTSRPQTSRVRISVFVHVLITRLRPRGRPTRLPQPIVKQTSTTEIAAGLDAQERELMLAAGADTEEAIKFAAEDSGCVCVCVWVWCGLV
jgi:hypothetical protein